MNMKDLPLEDSALQQLIRMNMAQISQLCTRNKNTILRSHSAPIVEVLSISPHQGITIWGFREVDVDGGFNVLMSCHHLHITAERGGVEMEEEEEEEKEEGSL